MAQRPVATGLLLCEQVIVEEKTRNVTPVNCFVRRYASHFPAQTGPMVLLAFLTDGIGEVVLEVIIERLDTSDEVYRRTVRARFTDPLQVVRFTLHIRDCPFPVSGKYEVALLADGELLAHRQFFILKKEKQS